MLKKLTPDRWAANVPAVLKTHPNWVAHHKKHPFQLRSRRAAAVDDPCTWGPFADAEAFYRASFEDEDSGVGFVFTLATGLVFVDFDHCLDERGKLMAWAKPLVMRFLNIGPTRAYVERSPSGTGLHVFTHGALPGPDSGHRVVVEPPDGKVEVYHDRRFSTVTGHAVAMVMP